MSTEGGGGEEALSQVGAVVLVLSGKGGVGKSTTCARLALSLARGGKRVGVLDVDLCGPSMPRILGAQGAEVRHGDGGWLPVERNGLKIMSIGFLLKNEDDAVVWRGPKKHAMIRQFLSDVEWGALDVLLVDTPPGTSDEHMSLIEALRHRGADRLGAVLVTTPQNVAVGDVRREATFCTQAGIRTLGVVENMSGYECPHCSECSLLFSSGGGEKLAELINVPFLGRVPIEPRVAQSCDSGTADIAMAAPTDGGQQQQSQAARTFDEIATKVASALSI